MPLWECRVDIKPSVASEVEAALQATETAEWSLFEDVLAGRVSLLGIFADEASARAGWQVMRPQLPRRGLGRASYRELPDIDWRESYKAHFKAWRCGSLHWIPEWERATRRVPRGHAAVYLDPGLAFGTGNHETTRLCCRRLVEYVQTLAPRARRSWRMIDAGTGSGILAISAAKLGCKALFAFDNDPAAVAVARENARRNGVGKAVRFGVGGLEDQLARHRADLVLANIQADVLMANAATLLHGVAKGGQLVLSGILVRELAQVREAFRDMAGRQWRVSSRQLGEWADLRVAHCGEKKKRRPHGAASMTKR